MGGWGVQFIYIHINIVSLMESSLTSVCGRRHAGSLLRVDVVSGIPLKGLDDLPLPSALVSHQLLVQIVS